MGSQSSTVSICKVCKTIQPDGATTCSNCKKCAIICFYIAISSLIVGLIMLLTQYQQISPWFILGFFFFMFLTIYYYRCTITEGKVKGDYIEFKA